MDISQQLRQTDNWSGLTAYERAKRCCQLLNTLGLPIPSWMQIRQWIGKGSANDIHRAKQDFLSDRQTVKTEWIVQNDLPTALSGSLQDWWQQLKQAAEQDYLGVKQHWQQEKTALQAQLTTVQVQLDQQQQQLNQLHEQLAMSQVQYQQVTQELDVKSHLAAQHALERQQLVDLFQAQQQHYFTEQARQHAQYKADQQQQQTQLTAQLEAVADFQRFAAEQIDQARQQNSQLQQQQQNRQQSELLAAIQQIVVQQEQQQAWLRHYVLNQHLAQDRVTRGRRAARRQRVILKI